MTWEKAGTYYPTPKMRSYGKIRNRTLPRAHRTSEGVPRKFSLLKTRTRIILCRLINTCWYFYKLALALIVVIVLAVGVYLYVRIDSEIRRQVEQTLAAQYPHLNVSVGAARLVEGRGIAIHNLVISETASSQLQSNLLVVDELLLDCDVALDKLVRGPPQIRRVIVRHPQVWLLRDQQGKWNLEALWPLPACSDKPPQVVIEDARLTLVDQLHPTTAPLSFQDVNCTLQATAGDGPLDGPVACGRTLSSCEFQVTVGGPHVRRAVVQGTCDLVQQTLDLAIDLNDLKVTPEIQSWALPYLGPQLEGVDLEGHVNGQLAMQIDLGGAVAPQIAGKLALGAARLVHPRLPRPLTDLSCEIRLQGGSTFIDGLRCNCGSSGLALQMERRGWGPYAPLSLAARAENVSLDKPLYRALPPILQQEWNKYKPTGTVDADLQLTFDGQRWLPAATLMGRNLAFESDKFPYRVTDGSGTLSYSPARAAQPAIMNINLLGHGGGQPLKFTGQVFDPQPGALGWIEVQGENVEIEDRMIVALPGKTRDVIQSLHPEGRFNVKWRIDRTLPGQLKPLSSLRLELVNCRVNYDHFPYPLSGIRGVIEAEDNRWSFHDLVSGGSRNVQCQGSLTPAAIGNELTLQFIGKEVPLDDELLRALPPTVQKAWSELHPRGRVDLVAEVYHTTGISRPSIRVAVRPRGDSASVQPDFFPYLLEQIQGLFTYENGRILMTDVLAHHGRTTMRTNGSGEFREDGSWQVQLEGLAVDRVALRRDLVVALPPKLQKLVDLLRPSGNSFGVSKSFARFSKRPNSADQVEVAWDVQVDCTGTDIQAGVALENIHGALRLRGSTSAHQFEQSGELALDSVTFQGVQFTDVRGPIWISETSCLIGRLACDRLGHTPRPLTAKAYDGTVAGNAWINFDLLPKYGVEATLMDASLRRIMVERFHSQQPYDGKMAASVNLQGAGRSQQALIGKGEVKITEANIYELPLLVGLLKVLRNGTPDTTAFNQSEIKFRLDGPHIYLDQFDFLGDAVSLYGQGTTNFDQELNLVFHGVVGRNDFRIPLVKNFVDRAGQQFMKMYVDGTASNPQIHTQALPGINNLIQQIQTDLETPAVTPPARQAELPSASQSIWGR